MAELKLSPEGKARLAMEFDQWTSDRSIRFETQAAVRQVEEGKARIANAMKYDISRGNTEGARRNVGRMAEAGYSPSEIEAAEMEIGELEATMQVQREIKADPEAWVEKLKDPETVKNTPGLTLRSAEMLQQEAERQVKDNTYAALEHVNNALADGSLRDPKQLDTDPRWSKLKPSMKAQIRKDMGKAVTDAERARRKTPEYLAEVTGYVTDQLDNYNVTIDGFDERFYAMDRAIRTLPEGVEKARLNDRLDRVRKQQLETYTDAGDDVRWQLAELKRTGGFGVNFTRQPIEEVIKDGILKDAGKLQRYGLDEKQAKKVLEASDEERVNVFREVAKQRAGIDSSDPYDRAALKVIETGSKGMVDYYNKDKALEAERNYGKAVSEFERWHAQNPQADETKRREKFAEIVGTEKAKAFDDFMEIPGLDGGVLPPLEIAPESPDFFIPPGQ